MQVSKKNPLKKIGRTECEEVIIHRYRTDRVAQYMATLGENKKYIGWCDESLFGNPGIVRNSGWFNREMTDKNCHEISALDGGAYIVLEEVKK